MKVSEIQKINFAKLKGFSNPKTAQTYRDLVIKYGKQFLISSNRCFNFIDKVSDDKDVFIKFNTYKDEDYKEKISIQIYDSDGEKIASSCIDSSEKLLTPTTINFRFEELMHKFEKNFLSQISLDEEIDKTINKFA